jgi:hypothetical protein
MRSGRGGDGLADAGTLVSTGLSGYLRDTMTLPRSGGRSRIRRAPTVSRRGSLLAVHHYDWIPRIDSFRTLCLAPPREVLAVFNELQGIARAG